MPVTAADRWRAEYRQWEAVLYAARARGDGAAYAQARANSRRLRDRLRAVGEKV